MIHQTQRINLNRTSERVTWALELGSACAYVTVDSVGTAIGTAVFEVKYRLNSADGAWLSFENAQTISQTGGLGPIHVAGIAEIAVEVTTVEGADEHADVTLRAVP